MLGPEILAEFILFARVKDRAGGEVEFQGKKGEDCKYPV